jgi:hypothetical protein
LFLTSWKSLLLAESSNLQTIHSAEQCQRNARKRRRAHESPTRFCRKEKTRRYHSGSFLLVCLTFFEMEKRSFLFVLQKVVLILTWVHSL